MIDVLDVDGPGSSHLHSSASEMTGSSLGGMLGVTGSWFSASGFAGGNSLHSLGLFEGLHCTAADPGTVSEWMVAGNLGEVEATEPNPTQVQGIPGAEEGRTYFA